MATVTLDTVTLSLASSPATMLFLDVPALEDTDSLIGEVRAYANGRTRSITKPGSTRTIPLAPDWVSAADIVTLKSWRGQTVLLRDPFGRKVWGVFYGVQVAERVIVGTGASTVSFTITEITYTEAV
jgi:hypothetical protein